MTRYRKGLVGLSDEEFARRVDAKRRARMEPIDAMSPDMRRLVNEYGMTVVKAHLDIGIQNPRHIRHLVETVLDEFSPTRGSYSKQGVRTAVTP